MEIVALFDEHCLIRNQPLAYLPSWCQNFVSTASFDVLKKMWNSSITFPSLSFSKKNFFVSWKLFPFQILCIFTFVVHLTLNFFIMLTLCRIEVPISSSSFFLFLSCHPLHQLFCPSFLHGKRRKVDFKLKPMNKTQFKHFYKGIHIYIL